MKASDVMTKFVSALKPDDTGLMLADIVCRLHVAGVPVVDDNNRVVGVVSEKDLMRKLYPGYGDFIENPAGAMDFEAMEDNFADMSQVKIRDIMTTDPIVATADVPLLKLASTMILKRIRRVPIVDEDRKLIGVVSQGDVHRAVFKCALETR